MNLENNRYIYSLEDCEGEITEVMKQVCERCTKVTHAA